MAQQATSAAFTRIDESGDTTEFNVPGTGQLLAYVDYTYDRKRACITVFDPSTSKSRSYAERSRTLAEGILDRHLERNGFYR